MSIIRSKKNRKSWATHIVSLLLTSNTFYFSCSLIQDCSDVWSRLFDHKTHVQSQLNSFIKEYEELRRDREVENLFDSLNVECEIQSQCNRIGSVDQPSLQLLKDKVGVCSNKADQILKFDKARESRNFLELRKQEREEKWRAFKKEMKNKYVEADDQFAKQQDKTEKFFEAQENKLKEACTPVR